MVGEGAAAVGGGNGGYGEDFKFAVGEMGGEVSAVEPALHGEVKFYSTQDSIATHHTVPDEMDTPPWVHLGYAFLEDFGAIYRAARRWDPCDQDLVPVLLQDLFDPAPVGNLHGSDGRTNFDAVETKQTMAKDDWVLGVSVLVFPFLRRGSVFLGKQVLFIGGC